MPLTAVALLLGAALAHATWNYFAKGARNDAAFIFLTFAASAVIYAPLALAAALTFARPSDWDALGFIAVSACLHVGYFFVLMQGYRSGDLSLVYPLARGSGPVLAVAGAVVLFGEQPTGLALAGAALIIGGILVMSWPSRTDASGNIGATAAFALATGACTAAYTLWDKRGVDDVSPLLYGYGIELAGMALLAPLALAGAEARTNVSRRWQGERRALLAIGALSPGAYMLVLAALAIAPVSYVAPGREVSILFGALIGWRVLGESDPGRRLFGAAAIVAGIFGLALG